MDKSLYLNKPGFVYIIQESQTSYYKIGFTTDGNIAKRLSILQVGNPHKLSLTGCFYVASQDQEFELHQIFKEKHISGEWYELTQDDLQRILSDNWRTTRGISADPRMSIQQQIAQTQTILDQLKYNLADLALHDAQLLGLIEKYKITIIARSTDWIAVVSKPNKDNMTCFDDDSKNEVRIFSYDQKQYVFYEAPTLTELTQELIRVFCSRNIQTTEEVLS